LVKNEMLKFGQIRPKGRAAPEIDQGPVSWSSYWSGGFGKWCIGDLIPFSYDDILDFGVCKVDESLAPHAVQIVQSRYEQAKCMDGVLASIVVNLELQLAQHRRQLRGCSYTGQPMR
jgi:hypothetical protein